MPDSSAPRWIDGTACSPRPPDPGATPHGRSLARRHYASGPRPAQLPLLLAQAQEQKAEPATQEEQKPGSAPTEPEPETKLAPVLVTAPPLFSSSSEQMIPGNDFELRPHGRPADVLRLIPGLIINQHQGGGKAEQYLLRGFDADHGTDIAIFVDNVPVNLRSHAHGQGYADINFVIPELISGVDFRKGPYFASEGDFSTAGAAHIHYFEELPQALGLLTFGTDGYGLPQPGEWEQLTAESQKRQAHLRSLRDTLNNEVRQLLSPEARDGLDLTEANLDLLGKHLRELNKASGGLELK